MLITCPMCDEEAFDTEAGICRHCKMRGTNRDLPLDEALDGLLHNARLQLAQLDPDGFQQVCGLLSDQLFQPAEAKAAHRHFQAHGVLCEHVVVSANRVELHSLILSPTAAGMRRALAVARRTAKQERMRLDIIPVYDA